MSRKSHKPSIGRQHDFCYRRMMNIKNAVFALVLVAAGGNAWSQQAGQFGAGVVLGVPIGGTAKYWLNDRQAFDFGVGFGDGDTVLYGDFLWHAWNIFPQPQKGKLGAYVGVGPRLETADEAEFAIRTMAGLDYWVENNPIELFLEGGPVFRFTPSSDVSADVGLGVRFYFGGSGASTQQKRRK